MKTMKVADYILHKRNGSISYYKLCELLYHIQWNWIKNHKTPLMEDAEFYAMNQTMPGEKHIAEKYICFGANSIFILPSEIDIEPNEELDDLIDTFQTASKKSISLVTRIYNMHLENQACRQITSIIREQPPISTQSIYETLHGRIKSQRRIIKFHIDPIMRNFLESITGQTLCYENMGFGKFHTIASWEKEPVPGYKIKLSVKTFEDNEPLDYKLTLLKAGYPAITKTSKTMFRKTSLIYDGYTFEITVE